MCGIIGVVSKGEDVIDTLMKGLSELQNRGYDSIGISLLDNNDFLIHKDVCRHEDDVEQLLSHIDIAKKYN